MLTCASPQRSQPGSPLGMVSGQSPIAISMAPLPRPFSKCLRHRVPCCEPQHMAVQGHGAASGWSTCGYQHAAGNGEPGNSAPRMVLGPLCQTLPRAPRHSTRQPLVPPAWVTSRDLTIWGLEPSVPLPPPGRGGVMGRRHPSSPEGT